MRKSLPSSKPLLTPKKAYDIVSANDLLKAIYTLENINLIH